MYRQIVITESFNYRKRRELKQIEVMRERERGGGIDEGRRGKGYAGDIKRDFLLQEEIKIKELMKRELLELKKEMSLLQQMNIIPKPLQKLTLSLA